MPVVFDGDELCTGVVELLRARKERALAEVVARSRVLLSPVPERWSMGAREVEAYRVSVVVGAADHVALHGSAEKQEALREAFAAAIRTDKTEMADLFVVLALPPSGLPFSYAYRDAPKREEEAPSAAAVLWGATRLLEARGDEVGAAVMGRAAVEQAVAVGSARTMRRYLVRLPARDLAAVEGNTALGDRLASAMRDAAATASEPVSAVVFGLMLEG